MFALGSAYELRKSGVIYTGWNGKRTKKMKAIFIRLASAGRTL
jgi:hypothetical protein